MGTEKADATRGHRAPVGVGSLWLVLALSLWPLLLACGASDGEPAAVPVRDSAGVRIVESDPSAAAADCAIAGEPSLDIGVAEGAPEYRLFRVTDATRLSDGRIAVVNAGSHEVRVYGPDGSFLHAFGREGDGPGEFRLPAGIWQRADSLVVYDARNQRLAWFEGAGAFVRAIALRPAYLNPPWVFLLADGRIVAVHHHFTVSPSGFREQPLYAILHAPDGQVADTLGRYAFGQMGHVGPPGASLISGPVFEPRTRIVAAGDRVYIGRGFAPEIEVLDPDGGLAGLIRWTGPDRTVTDEDVRLRREAELAGAETAAERAARRRRFDERPVSDRFPVLDGILIDRTDRVWVREYRRPAWAEERWLLFDSAGGFLCRARVPERLELLEVGPDHALGLWRDEVGVEHVRVHRLSF